MPKMILTEKEKEARKTELYHCMAMMSLDNDAEPSKEFRKLMDRYINGDIDEEEFANLTVKNAEAHAKKLAEQKR